MTMSDSGNGSVVVVEYLQSTMSRDLLSKFPDNSSYDFDYTQSSIWSPLVPRPFPSLIPASGRSGVPILKLEFGLSSSCFPLSSQRKLSYEDEQDGLLFGGATLRQVTTKFQRKITSSLINSVHSYQRISMDRKKKLSDMVLDLASGKEDTCPTDLISTPHSKGWSKVLRAASKRFKKKSKKHNHFSALKTISK